MDHFHSNGFAVVCGLLSQDDVNRYRTSLQKVSGLRDRDAGRENFACPDGVSKNSDFWPLIFHERLVEEVRRLIGPDARYTQHSDLHVHRDHVGWHRDSFCREFGVGPDWDESRASYEIVRVAIYLQSYEESESSLGVLPGTHQREVAISPIECRLRQGWERLRRTVTSDRRRYPAPLNLRLRQQRFFSPTVKPVWIPTEPGDCVIFNQRLFHSPSPIRGPKYAIYLSYGSENEHSRNHLNYYLNERPDLGYQRLDPKLVEQLRSAGLYLDADANSSSDHNSVLTEPESVAS